MTVSLFSLIVARGAEVRLHNTQFERLEQERLEYVRASAR